MEIINGRNMVNAWIGLVIGLIISLNGYVYGEDAPKESPNDYYRNADCKKAVDRIIEKYGGEEAINAVEYFRLQTSVVYTHDNSSTLWEVCFFSCSTTSAKTMKYRREDYVTDQSHGKNGPRELISGIICNGSIRAPLPYKDTGRIDLAGQVNRLFAANYSFIAALTTRLKAPDYSVTYKKDATALIFEIEDNDPEILSNRKTIFQYSLSTYLLKKIIFEDQLFRYELCVTEHKEATMKCGSTTKKIRYVTKYQTVTVDKESGKKYSSGTDTPIYQVSFEPFDNSIFNIEESEAEACFQLGVIRVKNNNDMAGARNGEWARAIKLDPAYRDKVKQFVDEFIQKTGGK
jgi:hypothetical protein